MITNTLLTNTAHTADDINKVPIVPIYILSLVENIEELSYPRFTAWQSRDGGQDRPLSRIDGYTMEFTAALEFAAKDDVIMLNLPLLNLNDLPLTITDVQELTPGVFTFQSATV